MKTFQSEKSERELNFDTTKQFVMVSDTHKVFKKGEVLTYVRQCDSAGYAVFQNDNKEQDVVSLNRLAYYEGKYTYVISYDVYASEVGKIGNEWTIVKSTDVHNAIKTIQETVQPCIMHITNIYRE